VVSHQVEQFLEESNFVQDHFEVIDVITQQKYNITSVYIKVKAQE
jgi:hypothetical protein